jgi:hypothetical protein
VKILKASEISIRVSPLTNTIYAGQITNTGRYPQWSQKKDVTEQVLSAVAQYMDGQYKEIEFLTGSLIWKTKLDEHILINGELEGEGEEHD